MWPEVICLYYPENKKIDSGTPVAADLSRAEASNNDQTMEMKRLLLTMLWDMSVVSLDKCIIHLFRKIVQTVASLQIRTGLD